MSNTVFASWVRDQRKKKRLSQTELANVLGVKPSHISRIEVGERGTSTHLLIKIAEFFRVPLEEVVYMSAGYKPHDKTSDTITRTIEKAIDRLQKRENKIRVLETIELLALKEEQENYATTLQKEIAKVETS